MRKSLDVAQVAKSARLRLLVALPVLLAWMAASAWATPLIKPKLVVWGYSEGGNLQQPRGIAFDPSDGAIYVGNVGEHRIDIFSRTGRPLARFVHRVSGPGGTMIDGNPVALAFDRAGRLLVVDQLAPYVDVLDRRGRPVTRLPIPAGHPSAVAVGPDGAIYVGTNAEESKIHRFRPDYAPDGEWGEEGTAPGFLKEVAALWVMGDSAVAVACERTDLVVQLFTPAGQYLRGFGTHEVGDGNFSLPSGLVVTADGRFWVLDEIRARLQVFDPAGNFVAASEGTGTQLGSFSHPSSLATDDRGWIALTDRGIGRVQVFEVVHE